MSHSQYTFFYSLWEVILLLILSLYSLCPNETDAINLEADLQGMGLSPRREDGRKIFLTTSFPKEELDELAQTFISFRDTAQRNR